MNILDKIVDNKRIEVAQRRIETPVEKLIEFDSYYRKPISISSKLNEKGSSGIIAEFKRKSPSKGIINEHAQPIDVTTGYEKYGASAVSILTDELFFGGADTHLIASRPHLNIPILRKEFIIDPYQIHEAKAMGADLILLIAACLSPQEVMDYSILAVSLGMEVLLELHEEEELGHVCKEVQLVGINNRSLKTFDVNIERSLRMAAQLPSDKIKVAESGIDDPSQVRLFRENGYKGFLIGENFMKTNDPALSLKSFIEKI
jgi:indole-3-glycerol phosphate synthase